MELSTNGDVRRRFDDDDTSTRQLLSPSLTSNSCLAQRMDSRAGRRPIGDDNGGSRNECALRLRWKHILYIFFLIQVLFLVVSITVYFINDDVESKLHNIRCHLPFGDRLSRDKNGYSIFQRNRLSLFTRRQNETIISPSPCDFNTTVTEKEEGKERVFTCLSQTFLYHNEIPYYAFRLFRRHDPSKEYGVDDDDDNVLVQGPLSKHCGDWISTKTCTEVQLVARSDLKTGFFTLGYPPIPIRKETSKDKNVSLYVDGSALVMTSLNNGRR